MCCAERVDAYGREATMYVDCVLKDSSDHVGTRLRSGSALSCLSTGIGNGSGSLAVGSLLWGYR